MSELKESQSKDLVVQHQELKEQIKQTSDSQLQAHYHMKLRKLEDLMK